MLSKEALKCYIFKLGGIRGSTYTYSSERSMHIMQNRHDYSSLDKGMEAFI